MLDDQKLIKEILDGSQAAMEVLMRKYYKDVYAFVYRKVGDKETAYDLTQEIFIKVVQKIQTFSSKGTFKTWLFTIAVNQCRDYWGSAYYKHSKDQAELPEIVTTPDKSVPYIFEKKKTREEIKSAINTLPEIQKEALVLKYYNGLKITEIANITNSNIPTVKSRLKQGLGKLSKLLNRGEEDEKYEYRK
ncbi:MAG: polymerase, sigma-24 subunit, subfamily [Bacillales bacterium]|jgi:RNA polymerase sigma-70 factor (ECF subfamily)|nr:polymerase, sigma-24 subunit, subfamily [Bacillales bacterium]